MNCSDGSNKYHPSFSFGCTIGSFAKFYFKYLVYGPWLNQLLRFITYKVRIVLYWFVLHCVHGSSANFQVLITPCTNSVYNFRQEWTRFFQLLIQAPHWCVSWLALSVGSLPYSPNTTFLHGRWAIQCGLLHLSMQYASLNLPTIICISVSFFSFIFLGTMNAYFQA